MKKALAWILITLFAILIFIFGFTFINQKGYSSEINGKISKIFSDPNYLDSVSGQAFSFEKKNACKPVWDAAKVNGWSENNIERFLDGGSSSSDYTKNGSKHNIHVFCKYEMSKGYYSSVRVEIK